MAERWEPKERKSFPFMLKDKGADIEERLIIGYFAVMGNFDGWDVIDKGAFEKTLKERGHRVKVFWIHDFYEPIGKPIELKEVPRGQLPKELLERAPDATGGLYAELKISRTRRGDEALVLASDGVLDEGSIGFDSMKEEWVDDEEDEEKQIRHIKELRLYDVSPVPIAMNPAAIITDVKAAWEKKVEVTDDLIHVPVPAEEGKHEGDDHTIRFIDIDADKGIRAKYCIEDAVVITFVFEKAKTWDVDAAVAWVKEHTKDKGATEVLAIVSKIFALEAAREAHFGALKQYAKIQESMLVDIQGQAEPG